MLRLWKGSRDEDQAGVNVPCRWVLLSAEMGSGQDPPGHGRAMSASQSIVYWASYGPLLFSVVSRITHYS
jgi:hypothetical protein